MTSFYPVLAGIITCAALIGYINSRFFRLPTTIAIMTGALLASLLLMAMGKLGYAHIEHQIYRNLAKLDFNTLLLQGMLSFLLFAGALSVDLNQLKTVKWEVITLASLGTVVSTFLIGIISFYSLKLFGIHLPLGYCLIFGALISPTDPIATLGILKEYKAPKKLHMIIAGESLFNDGVGIVLFIAILQIGIEAHATSALSIGLLFIQQAIGGISYGLFLGIIGHTLLLPLKDFKVEVLITLALTTSGYMLADYFHISGPLAMVTAGITIANWGTGKAALTRSVKTNLHNFWEMIDEILNTVLFFLLGIELFLIAKTQWYLAASLISIPIVLGSRFISIYLGLQPFMRGRKKYPKFTYPILTWGGLRGGLSVALALALPLGLERNIVLSMTYGAVLFAIIGQGLSFKHLLLAAKQDKD